MVHFEPQPNELHVPDKPQRKHVGNHDVRNAGGLSRRKSICLAKLLDDIHEIVPCCVGVEDGWLDMVRDGGNHC